MEGWKYIDWTIPAVLEQAARQWPDLTVSFTHDRAFTMAELLDRSLRVAGALRQRGVEPGDCVGIFLDNQVEFLTAYFGAAMAGCVTAPLNTGQRGVVLRHMLDLCRVRALVVNASAGEVIAPLIDETSTVMDVAIVGGTGQPFGLAAGVRAHAFETWEQASAIEDAHQWSPKDLATLMLTSGTTGASKAVMWSHSGALMLASSASRYIGYQSDDIAHTCLPLFHGNALYCTVLPAMMVGAASVVGPRFSASTFWQEVTETGATKLSLLGTMHRILFGQPEGPYDRAHAVQRAVVAPAPVGYHREFEERFGFELTQFYGLSDVNMVIGVPPELVEEARRRPGSCGVGSDYWELLVVDEDDRPVAPGEIGELIARPRIPFTGSLGYWRMPEATVVAWRNLWYHTGDAFRRDADGWYSFADRKKDAIRRAGENISSFEVENVLRGFAGVIEAAVYAVPSPQGEDDVMVAFEVDGSFVHDFDAMLRRCYSELAYFAIPRYFRVVDRLPRTESEKVRKDVLRSEGVTSSTWDRGPGGKKQLEQRLGAVASRSSSDQ